MPTMACQRVVREYNDLMGWISAYRQKADHHHAQIAVLLSSESARSSPSWLLSLKANHH